jgi:hypothetical protein
MATNPPPNPSPSAATPAPPATNPTSAALLGKGAAPLSPHAIPFYPSDTPGRTKSMRWSEESDFSDDDFDAEPSPPPAGPYSDAVRQSSSARDVLEAGTSSQPHSRAVHEPLEEAAEKGISPRPYRRKRGKRKRKPRSQRRREGDALEALGTTQRPEQMEAGHNRGPAHQRLSPTTHLRDRGLHRYPAGRHDPPPRQLRRQEGTRRERVPAHQWLGPRSDLGDRDCRRRHRPVAGDRVPAHLRLGPRIPRRGWRRISPPDVDGWREVLNRQGDGTPPPGHDENLRQRRRIPVFMQDRCLNCLSYTHKIASCRRPLRCWNCHGERHLARDCKRPRSPRDGSGGSSTAAESNTGRSGSFAAGAPG